MDRKLNPTVVPVTEPALTILAAATIGFTLPVLGLGAYRIQNYAVVKDVAEGAEVTLFTRKLEQSMCVKTLQYVIREGIEAQIRSWKGAEATDIYAAIYGMKDVG